MPATPMPDDPLDPIIRKKAILKDLGVRAATLADWVRARGFPMPTVLNPGAA